MSSSLGASLFEVISASVTFSVETTHEESHSYSWKASASIPEGQSGYLTFAPRLACKQTSLKVITTALTITLQVLPMANSQAVTARVLLLIRRVACATKL